MPRTCHEKLLFDNMGCVQQVGKAERNMAKTNLPNGYITVPASKDGIVEVKAREGGDENKPLKVAAKIDNVAIPFPTTEGALDDFFQHYTFKVKDEDGEVVAELTGVYAAAASRVKRDQIEGVRGDLRKRLEKGLKISMEAARKALATVRRPGQKNGSTPVMTEEEITKRLESAETPEEARELAIALAKERGVIPA